MTQAQDIELVKFSELQALITLGSAMKLLVESSSTEQLKTLTLDQLRQWILNSANLVNATANTPSLGDNTTKLATTQFVKTELGAVGLNPASQSAYGTVRTNITSSVPIVYLKSEVDDLVNATTPILRGGTGGTTEIQARSNLGAAQSGSNSDITALNALASIPALIQSAINSVIPVGSLIAIAYEGSPAGYLFCNGSAISRSTYSALFAVLGTLYGSGDGSTTFNLPDFRGRAIFGSGGSLGAIIPNPAGLVGAIGGSITTTLTVNELPTHNHGGITGLSGNLDHNHQGSTSITGAHAHNVNDLNAGNFASQAAGSAVRIIPGSGYNASTTTVGDHQHSFTTGINLSSLSHNHTISNQGNGQAFGLMNPYRLAKVLIKF